ncbi:hypothetical protein OBBRIDRAFT_497688 [Obba rivulosa]|uniref:Uncharacterized protein n=1 Tax=Obba rivulosa TaxID=1052685 RepID=A0A8E2DTS4_9APHY|nr:hypothetical protein OBBRIDRAFT_497688 [Obba rivulosa]
MGDSLDLTTVDPRLGALKQIPWARIIYTHFMGLVLLPTWRRECSGCFRGTARNVYAAPRAYYKGAIFVMLWPHFSPSLGHLDIRHGGRPASVVWTSLRSRVPIAHRWPAVGNAWRR